MLQLKALQQLQGLNPRSPSPKSRRWREDCDLDARPARLGFQVTPGGIRATRIFGRRLGYGVPSPPRRRPALCTCPPTRTGAGTGRDGLAAGLGMWGGGGAGGGLRG